MKIEWVSLDEVVPAERNPKDHDIGALMTSIRHFGFVSPVLRNEKTGRLVAGHGRLEALRLLWQEGGDPPKGIRALKDGTWKMPVISGVSFDRDEDAEAYLIADNRLAELGGWDEADLLDYLKELSFAGPEQLELTGYDVDDLAAMAARLSGDLPPLPSSGDGDGASGPRSHTCPSCGYEFTE